MEMHFVVDLLFILVLKEAAAQTVMIQSSSDIPDNYIPPALLDPSSFPVMNPVLDQVPGVGINQFPVLDINPVLDLTASQAPVMDTNQIAAVELSQRPVRPGPRRRLAGLCAAVSCIRGSVCRVVQPCRSCAPRAECINRNEIPFIADDICQNQNFREAILVESFRTQFSYRGLQCSPSGVAGFDTCPRGSACVGRRGFGRCCFGRVGFPLPVDKPGFCPRIFPGFSGVCGGQFCTNDGFCRGSQKCCPSACGRNTCTQPVSPGPRPIQGCGGCPRGTVCQRVPVNCIRPPCNVFSYECVREGPQSGFGQCPAPTRSFCNSVNSIDQCTSDFQCSRGERCCFDGCSRSCQFTRF